MFSLQNIKIRKNGLLYTDVIDILLVLYIVTVGISTENITNTLTNMLAVVIMGMIFLHILIKQKFSIGMFTCVFTFFIAFCFASLSWSQNISTSNERVMTVARLYVLSVLVYYYLKSENKLKRYINIICIGAIIYAIYILFYYGIDTYIDLLMNSERAGNLIGVNNNLIGRIGTVGTIICTWKVVYEKKKLYILGILLLGFITLGSGSRTGTGGMIAGVILLILLGARKKKAFRFIFGTVAIILILWLLLQLPVFETINNRMTEMFSGFEGGDEADASTLERLAMIELGWKQFLKTPVFGIGIGASGVLTVKVMGIDSYLHNNYLELLATGGVVGFVLYFLFFFVPLFAYIKNFFKRTKFEILGISILISYLVMQYGTVLYFDKSSYMHIILLFLIVDTIKERSEINE